MWLTVAPAVFQLAQCIYHIQRDGGATSWSIHFDFIMQPWFVWYMTQPHCVSSLCDSNQNLAVFNSGITFLL